MFPAAFDLVSAPTNCNEVRLITSWAIGDASIGWDILSGDEGKNSKEREDGSEVEPQGRTPHIRGACRCFDLSMEDEDLGDRRHARHA